MSRLTESVTKKIDALPESWYLFKIKLSESIAIRKKKKLYSDVKWTQAQQDEFDSFWQKNYGKRIKPWWAKLYESMNGKYCAQYFPEKLYSVELEPEINPPVYCKVFSDKSLTQVLFGGVDGVHFPETVLINCGGTFLSGKRETITPEMAVSAAADAGECVIKPTVESGSGKNVLFVDIEGAKDNITGKSLSGILAGCGKDYIVQKKLRNSDALTALFPNSLNTFRVITYIADGKISCAEPVLRLGVGDNKIDNIHRGGLCVGVNSDGTLKHTAYQLGYGDRAVKYEAHPDTGITFDGYVVGDIPAMMKTAVNLHARVPQLGMISWDLTFNDKEEICLIEANCMGQSVWFPQIVNEKPIFGENTEKMVKLIRK